MSASVLQSSHVQKGVENSTLLQLGRQPEGGMQEPDSAVPFGLILGPLISVS